MAVATVSRNDAFLNSLWRCALAPLRTRVPVLGPLAAGLFAVPAALVTGGYALLRWAALGSSVEFSGGDGTWCHTVRLPMGAPQPECVTVPPP
jgi:hypothetical protein